jgi:5-methylcytosine-specific restriction enzyme subunit McrC
VGVEQIEWRATGDAPEAERLLPGMRTDVTLRGDERVLVIDTKYYRSTLASHMGSEHVRSGHFAQIYAYLKNIEAAGRMVEGMLLYPTVDRSLDLEYEVDGHRVRVCTVDLGQEWRGIGERLLALVGGTAKGAKCKVER